MHYMSRRSNGVQDIYKRCVGTTSCGGDAPLEGAADLSALYFDASFGKAVSQLSLADWTKILTGGRGTANKIGGDVRSDMACRALV